MKDRYKTKDQLIDELTRLQQHVRTLEASETRQKRMKHTIKVSEERYSSLIESSNDMIFTVDLEGNFLSVNKAFKKNLGYSKEEVIR